MNEKAKRTNTKTTTTMMMKTTSKIHIRFDDNGRRFLKQKGHTHVARSIRAIQIRISCVRFDSSPARRTLHATHFHFALDTDFANIYFVDHVSPRHGFLDSNKYQMEKKNTLAWRSWMLPPTHSTHTHTRVYTWMWCAIFVFSLTLGWNMSALNLGIFISSHSWQKRQKLAFTSIKLFVMWPMLWRWRWRQRHTR